MAKINYEGPEEIETYPCLFDVEFELVNEQSGRAIVIANSPEDAVSMTEIQLLNGGVSINNADVYDVIYVDVDITGIMEHKSVIVGVTGIVDNEEVDMSFNISLTDYVKKEKEEDD